MRLPSLLFPFPTISVVGVPREPTPSVNPSEVQVSVAKEPEVATMDAIANSNSR